MGATKLYRTGALLAASALLAAMLPGVASAGPPVGGCPKGATNVPVVEPQYPGWNLMPVEAMVDEDVGNKHDQNADGYICQRFVIGQTNKHGFGVWVVKDNTKKLGRYLVVGEGRNWHDAVDYCESMGAHLVTINSRGEDKRVFALEPDSWLGATDEAEEGTWVWVTGEPFRYTNWAEGEPNDAGGEDYATYSGHGQPVPDGVWNDVPPGEQGGLPFVCEFEKR